MRVGHPDIALAVDAQANGFAVAIGRHVPAEQELACVGVELLNAGGAVDDVDDIIRFGIDDAARLNEVAVIGAEGGPHSHRRRRTITGNKDEGENDEG